jgi:predicted DNA-binding transcriptional regulator AlpA
MEDRLLSIPQLGAFLGVSRTTAHRLVTNGVFPVVVLTSGRRRRLIRIRQSALERSLRERECPLRDRPESDVPQLRSQRSEVPVAPLKVKTP